MEMSDWNAAIKKLPVEAERVETAAVRVDGAIYSVPRPLRHGDAIRVAAYYDPECVVQPDEQGFLTSRGRFVGRSEAKRLAIAARQILDDGRPDLFSEDVW